MTRPDYIPTTHEALDTWQRKINQFVTANAATWAIDAQTVTDLNNGSNTFDGLYKPIENRETRTLQQVAGFNHYRLEYVTFLRQLVQGSLVNNVLVAYADKIAMGLNPRSRARAERPDITTIPSIRIVGVGGGLMEFICTDSSDGRSARPANSDGIELIITIKEDKIVLGQGKEAVVEPATPEEIIILSSSKTRVRKSFTEAQRGKSFTVKGRWYNNSDRSKDGQYGNVVSGFVG